MESVSLENELLPVVSETKPLKRPFSAPKTKFGQSLLACEPFLCLHCLWCRSKDIISFSTCRCCCSLELRKGRQRLTWEASPHSIKDSLQSVISASDCLVFDGPTGAMFADNSNLAINVTILLCWFTSSNNCCVFQFNIQFFGSLWYNFARINFEGYFIYKNLFSMFS